jgi:hypothetical protein
MPIPLNPPKRPDWLTDFHRVAGIAAKGDEVVAGMERAINLKQPRGLKREPLEQWRPLVDTVPLPAETTQSLKAQFALIDFALKSDVYEVTVPLKNATREVVHAIHAASAAIVRPRDSEGVELAIMSTFSLFDERSTRSVVMMDSGRPFGIDGRTLMRILNSCVERGMLEPIKNGGTKITERGRQWFEQAIADKPQPEPAATKATVTVSPPARMALKVDEVLAHLSFMTNTSLVEIAKGALAEINTAYDAGAYLATMILCGTAVEAMVLDLAEQIENKLTATQKVNWQDSVALPKLVTELQAVGLLTETTRGLSVADHRDLVHPNRRRRAHIRVDDKAARAVMSLVEIVAHDLHDAEADGRLAKLKTT